MGEVSGKREKEEIETRRGVCVGGGLGEGRETDAHGESRERCFGEERGERDASGDGDASGEKKKR